MSVGLSMGSELGAQASAPVLYAAILRPLPLYSGRIRPPCISPCTTCLHLAIHVYLERCRRINLLICPCARIQLPTSARRFMPIYHDPSVQIVCQDLSLSLHYLFMSPCQPSSAATSSYLTPSAKRPFPCSAHLPSVCLSRCVYLLALSTSP